MAEPDPKDFLESDEIDPEREGPIREETPAQYEDLEEIGRGGMGTVVRTHDLRLDREVAKKILLHNRDPDLIRRFEREARLTGRLQHPNIPPVHDLGIDKEGRRFFTMRVVAGETLATILEMIAAGESIYRARYPLPRLLQVFLKVCDAIAFAHSRGVVHRDLKPENIMVGAFGQVLVMDWGLAKEPGIPELEEEVEEEEADVPAAEVSTEAGTVLLPGDAPSAGLTKHGDILGTPAYMPPEQAEGKLGVVDARSDVYSLGAILYEILTLAPPVTGETVLATLAKVTSGDIEAPTKKAPHRAIPREVEAITMKALSKKKENRYPDVERLAEDIQLYLDGRTVSAVPDSFRVKGVKWVRRNRGLTAGLSAAVLALMVLGWFLFFSPGTLTVRCPVDGAKGAIDGEESKTALPMESRILWPGWHRIRVDAPGYKGVERSFKVLPGRASTLDIHLKSRFGAVDVVTIPAGAIVVLDGRRCGETPLKGLKAEEGARRIFLEKAGYERAEVWVNVEAGSVTKIEKPLEHLKGFVEITSTIPEVAVTLQSLSGGAPVKLVTNVTAFALDTGKYRATFSKINYFETSREFEVLPGRTTPLHVELRTQKLWEVATPSTIRQAEVADVDGDGRFEIVISSHDALQGGIITVRSLTTFVERWSYRQVDAFSKDPVENHYSFYLADLDRDGDLDILARGPRNIFALDGSTGQRFLNYPLTHGRKVAVADLDDDGHLELLVGTSYRGLYALRPSSQTPLWHYWPKQNLDYVFSDILVEDFDHDGKLEVVFGTREGSVRCLEGATGREEWILRSMHPREAIATFADYDGDGEPEISLCCQGGRIRFIDPAGGREKTSISLKKPYLGPSLPWDINGDGRPDFLLASPDGDVLCMSYLPEGLKTWWRFHLKAALFAAPFLCDLEGDGRVEVVAMSRALSEVLLLDGEGRERTRFRVEGSPITVQFADLDDDGDLELIIPTEKGVAAFRFRSRSSILEIDTGYPQAFTPAVGDFNGDGVKDFAFNDGINFQAWDGRKCAPLWKSEPFRWLGSQTGVGDVDGDGADDLVIALGYHNAISILEGKTGKV
ncbi:MAG: protein kinase domain-containing protein, partial [Planctomycetota bacterium]